MRAVLIIAGVAIAALGALGISQLGGDDGKTLFCLTYDGQIEDLHQQKAAGAIETVHVSVGRGGSP